MPQPRDPDLTQIIDTNTTDLAALKATVISRWGRVPYVAADPASPTDGSVWINSADTSLRYRSSGVTASPGRIVGSADATGTAWTNATGVASDITATVGTAPTLTLTLSPGRKYLATFDGLFTSTVLGDLVLVRLVEGGVNRRIASWYLTPTDFVTVHFEYLFTPASSASVVYKMVGLRLAGTGTISASASVANPIQFRIEDKGL